MIEPAGTLEVIFLSLELPPGALRVDNSGMLATYLEIVSKFIKKITMICKAFPGGKESTCQCKRHRRHGFYSWVQKTQLEEEMAARFSILAWRIPLTEEPGRLPFIGSHRVRQD